MPALKPDLSQFEARLPKRGCAIAFLELTEQQKVDLNEALKTKHISAPLIAEVMAKDWGYSNITNQMVQRHRNGDCSCNKAPAEKVKK